MIVYCGLYGIFKVILVVLLLVCNLELGIGSLVSPLTGRSMTGYPSHRILALGNPASLQPLVLEQWLDCPLKVISALQRSKREEQ